MRDEELLYRFLLGELAEDEADLVEQRLLQEDALFELCEAIEADLLAASARGELTPQENERVLARLAASPGGRARLALAQDLVRLTEEVPVGAPPAPLPFRRADRAPSRWTAQWVAIAAGLLLAIGLYWDVNRPEPDHRESTIDIVRENSQPGAPKEKAPQPLTGKEETVAEQPSPPQPVLTPEPPPVPEPAPSLIPAVFELALATQRGGEPAESLPRFPVPKRTEEIEIQLDLQGAEEDSRTFDTRVTDHEAVEVWSQQELEPQPLRRKTGKVWATGLILKIPAKKLPEGKYTMWVKPEGETDPIGSQDFEIVAE
ncbi:MAG TPA: hypothetical protein VJ725_09540 [Thermoanaerobaculia bacterium]|nr:hypothetical protein [Thermoanaerobaculia bacterium]